MFLRIVGEMSDFFLHNGLYRVTVRLHSFNGCIMAQKRKKINGKYEHLPKGVTLEPLRGEETLVHYFMENGERKRKYYPATDEGLREVKKAAEQKEREKKEHGARFGSMSTDEKQAIELWRAYRDECMREACEPLPMVDVIKKALEMVRVESISPIFREVLHGYVRNMEHSGNKEEHMNHTRQRVKKIEAVLGEMRACHITPAMLEAFLDGLKGKKGGACALGTRKQYIVLLKAIFSVAVNRKQVKENPACALEKPKIERGEPEILTVETCRAIMRYAMEKACDFIPTLALNLFCGVRPEEIARSKYGNLKTIGDGEIYIPHSIAKTRARHTPLRNAAAWIDYAKEQGISMEQEEYIIPSDGKNRANRYAKFLERVTRDSGVVIPKDSMRHTAASMLSVLHGAAAASIELGHTVAVHNEHYRQAVTKEEAKAFFEITPASLGL